MHIQRVCSWPAACLQRARGVDCWMEIQHGKGPWANPVGGIVPLGTTLIMVIGIND